MQTYRAEPRSMQTYRAEPRSMQTSRAELTSCEKISREVVVVVGLWRTETDTGLFFLQRCLQQLCLWACFCNLLQTTVEKSTGCDNC